MKVLLIEDNPVDLKLMQAVLQMEGHEAHERTSAAGAIEAVRKFRPAIILLDLNLTDGDGLAVVRELQQHWDTRSIPVVAVTAYPMRYNIAEVLEAGCSRCIIKPINTRELVRELCALAADGTAGRLS